MNHRNNNHILPAATVAAYDDHAGLTLHRPRHAYSSSGNDDDSEHLLIPPSDIVCFIPQTIDEDDDANFGTIHILNYTTSGDNPNPQLEQIRIQNAPRQLIQSREYSGVLPEHLNPAARNDVTVIVSQTSGGGRAAQYYDDVLDPFLSLLSVHADIVHTTSASSISETISQVSARATQQTVVLLSGDTGIFDALNAQADSLANVTLSIFPLGTGNALASSVHTSRGISPLAALLFGKPHTLPTFRVRFSPGSKWISTDEYIPEDGVTGAVVVSWGFHASLVADSESLRGEGVGVERFQRAANENLQNPHTYRGRLLILPPGDTEWHPVRQRPVRNGTDYSMGDNDSPAESPPDDDDGDGDKVASTPSSFGSAGSSGSMSQGHFYALATMCSNLEEAFRISPGSILGEQLIRVVHFQPMERGDVEALMGGAYQGGTHVDDERVGYVVARGVRIEMDEEEERWRRVCVDGATVVLPRDGWVESIVNGSEDGDAGLSVLWIE